MGGCASIAMGSIEDDARATNFAVRPDKSSIYGYRNERLGFAAPMSVSIDGRLAGKTLASTFWVWEVDPGEYSIAAPAEDITAETLRT